MRKCTFTRTNSSGVKWNYPQKWAKYKWAGTNYFVVFLKFCKVCWITDVVVAVFRPFFKPLCLLPLSFLLFKDIPDQCSPSPCHPGGTVRCEDKKGDFLCHCFTGWAGARCEKGTVMAVGSDENSRVCICTLCTTAWPPLRSIRYDLGGDGGLCPHQ